MDNEPGPPRFESEPGSGRQSHPVESPASWGATGPANARRQAAAEQPWETRETRPDPPKPSGSFALKLPAVLATAAGAALIGGIVAGVVVASVVRSDEEQSSNDEARAFQALTIEQTNAISQAATTARASVVRIESTKQTQGGGTEQDIGSGVILDLEGHIVTNAHVVLNTDSLKVILADGTERPAILIGHDYPFTDVAVLQIGPGKLTPIEPGDSGSVKLGESVVVVGNPLAEFDGSISVGVISGMDRIRILDGVRQVDLLQTDAAVNHGNSGGALVNLSGQFIGMPTAVIRQSRSGATVEGIAFALPSNRVLEVARAIIQEGGQYARPSIQAEHIDLSPEVLAKLPRVGAKEGAYIAGVAPGGVAAEAGIQAGDIITRVGDHDVNLQNPLFNVLMTFEPGQSARVVLNRNGRIIEAEVRFAQRS